MSSQSVTMALKMRLSHMTAAAIWERMNNAFRSGSSPCNSLGSLDPSNAMNDATGTGNNSATDNSIGKLRLNATLDIVVGTGIRSTAAIAAIQMMICQSDVKSDGSWIIHQPMKAR